MSKLCDNPQSGSLENGCGEWLCACGKWHAYPKPDCTCDRPIQRRDIGRPGRIECARCGGTVVESKLVTTRKE